MGFEDTKSNAASLGEQIRILIGDIRGKITTLTAELAVARKELADARAALIVPRKRTAKVVVKKPNKKAAPTLPGI